MDTIFALATAQGKAGVAVVRISGPRAFDVCEQLSGTVPVPRVATLRTLKDQSGDFIDQALLIGFKAPSSFTGEDVVELHLHGSIAIVRAILRILGDFEGLRLAEPGEFTRRALENGQLDIARVEGLADLIESETEAQRKQALRSLSGDLGKKAQIWRTDLIRAAALLEATIDFADEDVPVDVSPEVSELLDRTLITLKSEASGVAVAERIRSGFVVAIVGAPNVGKSTLLNALAGRDAAITSEIAGTTRDVIEVQMDIKGLPVTVLDTAGVRDTDDVVETLGIEKAIQKASDSDITVFLTDTGDLPNKFETRPHDIILKSKGDLTSDPSAISGKTGQGVDMLISNIYDCLIEQSQNVGVATRERHRIALERAADNLSIAQGILSLGPDQYEICSEEIRSGIRALDSLIGHVDVESILDEIFSSFCLGK